MHIKNIMALQVKCLRKYAMIRLCPGALWFGRDKMIYDKSECLKAFGGKVSWNSVKS